MNVMTLRRKQGVECRFCSLLGGAADVFESTWLSAGNYRAMVSVGALVPGWSLVCPVNHEVNLSNDYSRREFWDFASTAAWVLENRYGPCAFFEHGSGSEGSLTGCGVDHAHGHLVPLDFSLQAEARRSAQGLTWRNCSILDVKALSSGREYLFVSSRYEGSASTGSLCVLEEPTSQFFRRVIAQRLGIGNLYDYKANPMLEMASESAKELRVHVGSALAGV